MRRTGFTVVELLVVVAIISVLAGMLLPALQKSIETARAVCCINNLRQMGDCTMNYANDFNGWLISGAKDNLTQSLGVRGFGRLHILLAYLNYLQHDNYAVTSPKGYKFTFAIGGDGKEYGWATYYPPYLPMHACPSLPLTLEKGINSIEYIYGVRATNPVFNIGRDPVLRRDRVSSGTFGAPISTNRHPSKFLLWGDSLYVRWGDGFKTPNQLHTFSEYANLQMPRRKGNPHRVFPGAYPTVP